MKFIATFCLLCISFLSTNAYAQTDFIKEMQDTYRNLNSFEANFEQELFHRESQHTQFKTGNFKFKKDVFIRLNTLTPSEEILIINPSEVWNYIPQEEIAYKYSAEIAQGSQNVLSVITGQIPLDESFDIEAQEDVYIDNKMLKSFKVYPFEPSVEMTEATLLIDPETKLIVSAEVFDFYGNINSIIFDNFKLNSITSEADFHFSPPANIEIEDHSNTNINPVNAQ